MSIHKNDIYVFLMYSTAMLTLPLLTFYGVKNLLDKEFHITGFANTAWSVISAVIVVNLIIMAYAWRAYKQQVAEQASESSKRAEEDVNLKKSD